MDVDKNIFYDEFMDKLTCVEDALLDVQNGAYDKENINEVFRSMHTVKSTADLLGMIDVVNITHKAEDLLDEVRNEKVVLDDELCAIFIDLKHLIVELIDNLLNGIDTNRETKKLLSDFEKELLSYMPKESNETESVKTILIVDDSSLIREKIKYTAQENGYRVLTACDVIMGLELIKNNNIDLLFCDVSTPLFDGLELIYDLKKDSVKKFLPIVILVNKESKNIGALGKITGAKAWLVKPCNKNKLSIILEKILG